MKDLTIDTDEIRIEKQENGKYRQFIRKHNTNIVYSTGKEYEDLKTAFGESFVEMALLF